MYHSFKKSAVLAVASLAIVAGTAAAPASARGRDCPDIRDTSTPFAALGDTTPYVLAAGGSASLADGQSLTTECQKVHKGKPVVRFFAQSTTGSGSLHVELLVSGKVFDAGYVTAATTMGAAAQVVVPVKVDSGNPVLQVRLTAVGGSFDVGDVYIDPFVQR